MHTVLFYCVDITPSVICQYMLSIYPYGSGLHLRHWGNRLTTPVSVQIAPEDMVKTALFQTTTECTRARTWWRYQMETFSALLAICAGNSPVPVNSPHNGQWRGALMFTLICARINGWVNNREAGDLRRHRCHYDVIVMKRMHNHFHYAVQDLLLIIAEGLIGYHTKKKKKNGVDERLFICTIWASLCERLIHLLT